MDNVNVLGKKWIRYFLESDTVPQRKHCLEQMKACRVTGDMVRVEADAFLREQREKLDSLEKTVDSLLKTEF